VSRWSANSLRIALAPGEVALSRPEGTPATRVLTTEALDLHSLLPLLEIALAEAEWRRARVEVVVSQHFVRHVLTPPPGKALSRVEEHALVKGSLRDIYGDTAEEWQLQVMSQPPQYGLLGAAMDARFLVQLDALLTRHGFRDIAIHPLATVAARHLPRNYAGWWVLAESGWLSLFAGTTQAWQHVTAQPVDAEWRGALPDLIARETELAAQPPASAVWVQAVGTGAVAAPAVSNLKWRVLPHNPETRGALALLEY